jgi:signal transduction histidine kinase
VNVPFLLYALLGLALLHCLCVLFLSVAPVLVNVTSLLAVLEPALSALLLLRLSSLYPEPQRLAWRWMGISSLFFMVGSLLNASNIARGKPLSPSLADPFLIVGGVLLLLALLRLPRPATQRLQGVRLFVDVSATVIVFATYFWRFAFAPQVVAQGAAPVTIAIQTLYILLGFTALSVLIILAFWTRFSRQATVLVIGTGIFVFANMALTLVAPYHLAPYHLTLSSTPWLGALLAWGYLVFCWGAYTGLSRPYSLELISANSPYMRRLNRSPYSSIVLCYLLVLAPPPKAPLVGLGVIVGLVLITLIVLLRQWVQLSDNEKLTDDLAKLSSNLEQRIAERSKQLEDSQSRLVASEKLASLGRITAGLAHEINTPLAAAMHSLYHAKELAQEYKNSLENPSVTKEDYKEIARELEHNLGYAQTSLERLGEFVRRMRSQTRVSSDTTTFYPSQLIRDVVAVLQPRANELQVTLGFFEPSEIVTLQGDDTRFSQVVSNLLVNALDACEGKANGFVNVKLLADEAQVRLEVHDNGVGIPEDIRAKIFEPMFTTKDVGQGTGLGLAVVYDIVHGGFGGDITVESTLGQGSSFIVRLPLSSKETALVRDGVSTA